MIRKLIVLIAAVFAFAVLANYIGIINMKGVEKKPAVLEARDGYVLKMSKTIEKSAF